MNKAQKSALMKEIQSKIYGYRIAMTKIVPMCSEVERAIDAGEDRDAAITAGIEKYAEKVEEVSRG